MNSWIIYDMTELFYSTGLKWRIWYLYSIALTLYEKKNINKNSMAAVGHCGV